MTSIIGLRLFCVDLGLTHLCNHSTNPIFVINTHSGIVQSTSKQRLILCQVWLSNQFRNFLLRDEVWQLLHHPVGFDEIVNGKGAGVALALSMARTRPGIIGRPSRRYRSAAAYPSP